MARSNWWSWAPTYSGATSFAARRFTTPPTIIRRVACSETDGRTDRQIRRKGMTEGRREGGGDRESREREKTDRE